MRSRAVIVILAVLVASTPLAFAKDAVKSNITDLQTDQRWNGTFGNFSMSGGWTGAYEVTVDVSATTAGDYTNTALNMIFLAGQVYNGLWTTATWTSYAYEFHPNSTPNRSFSSSFTFTVPAEGNYAIWGRGFAGVYSGTLTGGGVCPAGYICRTQDAQTCCYPASAGDLFPVYSTAPPTATPDPNAGGTPIPTMNRWGVLAMIVILAGVAMLLFTRRS